MIFQFSINCYFLFVEPNVLSSRRVAKDSINRILLLFRSSTFRLIRFSKLLILLISFLERLRTWFWITDFYQFWQRKRVCLLFRFLKYCIWFIDSILFSERFNHVSEWLKPSPFMSDTEFLAKLSFFNSMQELRSSISSIPLPLTSKLSKVVTFFPDIAAIWVNVNLFIFFN